VGPSSAVTIAAASAKPSVLASEPKAASVGAKTVRFAAASFSAGTRPALSAAATSALKPDEVATSAIVPGGTGSSSPLPQAASTATAETAASRLIQCNIEVLLKMGARKRAIAVDIERSRTRAREPLSAKNE